MMTNLYGNLWKITILFLEREKETDRKERRGTERAILTQFKSCLKRSDGRQVITFNYHCYS